MLARLLNYKDCEIILRLAREKVDNGAKRLLFKFNHVKLRPLQLSYAMLYPAKLRVTANGQTQFFELATEAASWLNRNE